MIAVKLDLPVTDIPEEETDARKIEKRRSWKEITSSASSVADPSPDDYAIELELFERDDIDNSLWAKHLVEAKGDKEEAKWLYVKERAVTAPARRAEADRLEKQRRQAEENAITKREEQRRAELEAEKRRIEAAATKLRAEKEAAEKIEAEKKREEEDFQFVIGLTFMLVGVFIFLCVIMIKAQP